MKNDENKKAIVKSLIYLYHETTYNFIDDHIIFIDFDEGTDKKDEIKNIISDNRKDTL